MAKYLNFFEEVYYINTDWRPDRKKLFEERSKAVGISAVRWPATQISVEESTQYLYSEDLKNTDPEFRLRKSYDISCSMSHMAIIREAKRKGLQNVMIFEDDAFFYDNFPSEVELCVSDIVSTPIVDWDMIYFGGEPNVPAEPITENLATIKNGGIYALHAYAVNRRYYDTILSRDLHWCNSLDVALLHVPSDQRKYLLSRKLLAIQDPESFSDLRGNVGTYGYDQITKYWKINVTDRFK